MSQLSTPVIRKPWTKPPESSSINDLERWLANEWIAEQELRVKIDQTLENAERVAAEALRAMIDDDGWTGATIVRPAQVDALGSV